MYGGDLEVAARGYSAWRRAGRGDSVHDGLILASSGGQHQVRPD